MELFSLEDIDYGRSSVCAMHIIHVYTNVGWFFEFLKKHQFQFFMYFRIKESSILVLEIFQKQRTLNFGFLKKVQNQRIVSSNCFKTSKN
jgi:predicted site-specific integrase-resolvase